MTRKMKRTLSLILALVMLCSTMGVMAFAAAPAMMYMQCFSTVCEGAWRTYLDSPIEGLNRVIECPEHRDHDAEEWYRSHFYKCEVCGKIYDPRYEPDIFYVCLP